MTGKPRIKLLICFVCGETCAPMGTTPNLLKWGVQSCPRCGMLNPWSAAGSSVPPSSREIEKIRQVLGVTHV